MRFSPHLLDEIRARLPVSQVVSRKVALKRRGREFVGLSPFKVEKTPSFTVNDAKGFYHCFASGEHGDIFTFVMKTEGLSFTEAVERLAAEAGVTLPKLAARDVEVEDQRTRLHALLEASAKFFEEALRGPEGRDARRYLEGRQLTQGAIARFRLGYAAPGRSVLKEHLAAAGFSLEDMIASGMLVGGPDIPVAYDRFRNRLMFPITDLKGRVIAFGGRALDPEQEPKYLNSPETVLFHKGATLYNAASARSAAHERRRIIAVEGYMDVIALAEAGFDETVAPLGTALTEEQMRLLWRMAPEPILCFDGDSAGRKAAFRAIDTVLPHLKPGQSVAFAFMPNGCDPDDLVRQQGAAAMNDVLERVRPLADVLWEREWGSASWSTPERRAGLERQLKGHLARIADGDVRQHYERDMRRRLEAAWGGPGRGPRAAPGFRGAAKRPLSGWPGRDRNSPANARTGRPSSSLLRSSIVAGGGAALPYRESLLLRTLLNHPWLLDDHAEEVAALTFTAPALSRLRDAILCTHALDNSLDRKGLRSQLSKTNCAGLMERVERTLTHRSDRFAEPEAERGEVELGWRHTLALHERQVDLRRSLQAAELAWHSEGSEEALARICEIQRQLARVDGAEVGGATGIDP